MFRKLLFLFALLNASAFVYAQNSKALKEDFLDAEYFFINEDYPQALNLYLKLAQKLPDNYNVVYRIGLCYLDIPFESAQAIPYLEEAVQHINPKYNEGSFAETQAEPEAFYYLGYAYHRNYHFDEAITAYTTYKNQLDVKKLYYIDRVDKQIAACKVCKQMIQNPTKTHFFNLGERVNTEMVDYNPCVSANDSLLIFTRVRPKSSSEEAQDAQSVIWDYHILMCHRINDSTWSKPQDINAELQTSGTYQSISLSPDGKTLFLFRDNYNDGGVFDNDRGALYISHRTKDSWSVAQKLPHGINTLFNETHVSISANGKLLCFTSDRKKGGLGGSDIYYCTRDKDTVWSEPKNIGAVINTPLDEEAPTIVNDTILVFSSEGHNTMGGFDLFYSKQTKDGWSEPISLRTPINTPADEMFFIPVLGGRIAYTAAERRDVNTEEFGALDLYKLDPFIDLGPASIFTEAAKLAKQDDSLAAASATAVAATESTPAGSTTTPLATTASAAATKLATAATIAIAGHIATADNGELDKALKVTIRDMATNSVVATLSPDITTGTYTTALPAGNYRITTESDNYTALQQIVYVPTAHDGALPIDSRLVPKTVASGKYYSIKAVFFEFNSAELTRDAQIELERLYVLMNENPTLKLEVVGHTDSKGSLAYNQALSLKRSQAVTAYLEARGVEAYRFVTKGEGENANIAINENKDGSDNAEGRRLNRRVEIEILRTENDNIVTEAIPVPDYLAYRDFIRYSVLVARVPQPFTEQEHKRYADAGLPKLQVLHVDSGYVYYTGDCRRKSEAMLLLNKVQEAGFTSASITDYFQTNRLTSIIKPAKGKRDAVSPVANVTNKDIAQPSKNDAWFTIQIEALRKPNAKLEKKKMFSIYSCDDGLTRYAYGRYTTIDEARQALKTVQDWGYPDAFVATGQRYFKLECHCTRVGQ